MATSRQWAHALTALEKQFNDVRVADAFFAYATTQNLTHLIPGIVAHLSRIAERDTDHETLKIAAAHTLSPEALEYIRTFVGAPQNVSVTTETNAALIGGFVAEHHGIVYDGSCARQLEKLHASLVH